MGILAVLSFTQGLATFSQVLLGLPAALSLLGPSSFLLLSLLFTAHHLLYSTLRLCLKNTWLAPLVSVLAVLSPAISAALALLTLYFHLAPPPPGPSLSHCLVNILPFAYAQILRWVSPLFTLLEGISTLLVIQVAGRVGKGWADEEDRDDGLEWRTVVALVAAALVYCAGLAGVIKTFPSLPLPAFLLGAALTAVLFLSLIGFSLKRTNVLETSLVFVYVVYSAWLSGVEAEMPSGSFASSSWFPSPSPLRQSHSLPPTVEPSINSLLTYALHSAVPSFIKVSETLPPHLVLSLIYRVTVLHLAAKIVPVLRRASMGWDDRDDAREGFWDGRTLGDEPANMRITTVFLSYRRAILIAVYTHLLLLDGGSQTWWRWVNIALLLAVWSLELLLDAEGDDTDSVTRWKVD
ncbi:hypothetical protein J008_00442 [Cryptococcus neoformans]|nr:hypothetical protein C362_04645 [Cryptococcus neoformans var. grubii Bt1]OXC66473.1 hypothetical protein AYX13_04796 [Cryptococcus neoformans var. grubii]OXG23534.1 hypothetical protein C366_00433 [Cryptococcus neoformans var. grubii Tu401-1]OXH41560.1 hypothetical protein J008_00442 [Cryptococcus neoformans var. grubii]